MDDRLSGILNKVNALLNLAEHEGTPEHEAKLARQRAEAMMLKYRIEEEELRQGKLASNAADAITPIVHEVVLCNYGSDYRGQYLGIFGSIVAHVGNLRWAWKYKDGQAVAWLVGFESDVRYAEALYTSLRLHFANTLEPTVDPMESDEENVYRLRTAGIERVRIAAMLWPGVAKQGAKVTRLYEQACRARGEDPTVVGRNVNVKHYRASFAEAYESRIWHRLWEMRASAREEAGGLVLKGREAAVDEKFYQTFPHLRPVPVSDDGVGGYVDPREGCARCQKASSGYCREHAYLKPTERKERPTSALGYSAGRRAANSADLGGTTSPGRKMESTINRDGIES